MECDIHWVIERYHPETAKWETVLSEDGEAFRQIPVGETVPRWDLSGPGEILGARCYEFFAALSQVPKQHGDAPWAHAGLPEDVSDFAFDVLDDMHTPGWISLADLRRIASSLIDSKAMTALRERLTAIDTLLAMSVDGGPTFILRGRGYCPEREIYLPDIATLSNHEKMRIEHLARSFGPLCDNRIRLLVAYD